MASEATAAASTDSGTVESSSRLFVPGGTALQRVEALVDGVRSTVGEECANCCKQLAVILRAGLLAENEIDPAGIPAVAAALVALRDQLENHEVVRCCLNFLNAFVTASMGSYLRTKRLSVTSKNASPDVRQLLELKEIAGSMTMSMVGGTSKYGGGMKAMQLWGEADPTVADRGRRRLVAISAVPAVVAAMRRYPRHVPIQIEAAAILQAVSYGSDPVCLPGLLLSDVPAAVAQAATTLDDRENWAHMLLRGFVTWTLIHLTLSGMVSRRAVLAVDGLGLLKSVPMAAAFGQTNLYCCRETLQLAAGLLEGALAPDSTLASCDASYKTQKHICNLAMNFAIRRQEEQKKIDEQRGIVKPRREGLDALTLTADDFIGPTDEEMRRATAMARWYELMLDSFIRVTLSVSTGRVELTLSMTPASSRLSKYCALCGSRADAGQSLLRCGRCRKLSFCSAACLRSAWKKHGHKEFCGEHQPSIESILNGSPAHVISSFRLFGRWQVEIALMCLERIESSVAADNREDWDCVGVVNAVAEIMQSHEEMVVQNACVSAMFCLLNGEQRLQEAADKGAIELVLKAMARVVSTCVDLPSEKAIYTVSQALDLVKAFGEHTEALRDMALEAGAIESVANCFAIRALSRLYDSALSTLKVLCTSHGSLCARRCMRARLATCRSEAMPILNTSHFLNS